MAGASATVAGRTVTVASAGFEPPLGDGDDDQNQEELGP
jgi:hypothetical protein